MDAEMIKEEKLKKKLLERGATDFGALRDAFEFARATDDLAAAHEHAAFFADQQKKTPWGYSLDYYLSSLYSCTPSYIKIFTADDRVTTDVLIDLLKNMPDEKRAACDRKFAAEYLKGYFA